ncbi:MAG: prenyltransferase [Alphaproteobacteria bacterium]|nr:prenyltransferase [Alphaproteobacteria bacterium]
MKGLYLAGRALPPGYFDGAVRRILALQTSEGAIPWFDRGVWDPWNHTESLMGLLIAGKREEADRAMAYLMQTQEKDGSWWAEYGSAVSLETGKYEGTGREPKRRDTNFIAYPAVGVWHHFAITGDEEALRRHWPMVEAASEFVLAHQSDHGEIRWAADDAETRENDALLTGNASIFKSLECAILIAERIGAPRPAWVSARARLGEAVRGKPHRFDRTWEKKDYFSMDWYYPVLAGAVTGESARAHLAKRWDEFVEEGRGCRCVLGQPWVTVAEGCELTLALLAAGQPQKARELFSWQHQWRSDDGDYWMGWQFEENVPWPQERPAWTAAAVLLAADALTGASAASRLLIDHMSAEPLEEAQRANPARRSKQP